MQITRTNTNTQLHAREGEVDGKRAREMTT